jgi:alkanesulfonate monooxygenase SsuD/methylene tetrahydromethanopterin reductase-like flavin-dependent oxidoreductase (luciferase family)
MASDLVAHRVSLAYTGRDLSQQVTANLVGSPELIREKVAGLAALGVQHCCALMFPASDLGEYREQVAWFAEVVGLTPP